LTLKGLNRSGGIFGIYFLWNRVLLQTSCEGVLTDFEQFQKKKNSSLKRKIKAISDCTSVRRSNNFLQKRAAGQNFFIFYIFQPTSTFKIVLLEQTVFNFVSVFGFI